MLWLVLLPLLPLLPLLLLLQVPLPQGLSPLFTHRAPFAHIQGDVLGSTGLLQYVSAVRLGGAELSSTYAVHFVSSARYWVQYRDT